MADGIKETLRRFQFMAQEKSSGRWGTLPGELLNGLLRTSSDETWSEVARSFETVEYTDPATGAVLRYSRTVSSTFEVGGQDRTVTLEFLQPALSPDAVIVDSGTIS